MFIEKICPPALIYLIYSFIQIVVDTLNGLYNTAFIKLWVSIIFTALLNILCDSGLGIISWTIVFLPFILTALLTTILLIEFGLDPSSGKLYRKQQTNDDSNPEYVDAEYPKLQDPSKVITSDTPYVINIDGLTHSHKHLHDDTSHYHAHTHSDPYNTKHL
tara:strand:- start:127 stop:609 length:483 start_codon:yes stop_codon:yes gene_type:complete